MSNVRAYVIVTAVLTCLGAAPAQRVVKIEGKPSVSENELIMDALGRAFNEEKPFTIGRADLNGDGVVDLLFRSDNPSQCTAHGCPTYAALSTESGVGNAIELAISFGDVIVLRSKTHGMFDLRYAAGGPIFRWDGRAYR